MSITDWTKYERLAASIAWKLTKNKDKTEEMISACKVAFIERLELMDNNDNLRGYLYMVFRGTCMDLLKLDKKYKEKKTLGFGTETNTVNPGYPLFDLMERVSDDAREIINRVMHPEMLSVKPKNPTPCALRMAIREELSWPVRRWNTAMATLREMIEV